MPVDIRATVTCSLGPLISASISDDYIQGNGVVKCRGNCEISGLISPTMGSAVTFKYTKDGITRAIPRKLLVLSSFADPFRRTTKVELGCRLTYMQDVKDPIDWSAFDDPENEDLTLADTIVTLPIFASSVAAECLGRIGLSGSAGLTNAFSIEKFDFSPGYVQVLSDLLVSECKCGYVNASGTFEVFSLSQTGGSGPSIGEGKIIDIGPIGVGDMPADSVTVSYSSLKLKAPDNEEVVCRDASEEEDDEPLSYTESEDSSTKQEATFSYRYPEDGALQFATYSWTDKSATTTNYRQTWVLRNGERTGVDGTKDLLELWKAQILNGSDNPVVERKNLVTSRTTTVTSSAAAVAGGYAQQLLNNGFPFNTFDIYKTTQEVFSYDNTGNETRRVLTTTGSLIHQYGNAGIDFVYEDPDGGKYAVSLGSETGFLERVVTKTTRSGRFVKTTTWRYGPWADTISGQQAIANARESIQTAAEAESFLDKLFGKMYLLDVTYTNSAQGPPPEEVPLAEQEATADLADEEGDPNNGFAIESTAGLELITGTSGAGRRIELRMPYAPDDRFERRTVSTDPLRYCYYAIASDAEAKANAFGRAQNRLLMGNRNGINIQTVPEVLPNTPFGAFFLTLNGVTTMYRTNGMTWTMDANGVVASTDALYWGVAGKA